MTCRNVLAFTVLLTLAACDDGGGATSGDAALDVAVDAAADSQFDASPTDAGNTDGGGPDAAPRPKVVIVGTGDRDFEPLVTDAVLRVEQGFQGGYHVWGGWRAPEIDDAEVEFALRLRVDGEVVAQAGWLQGFLPDEPRMMFGVMVAFAARPLEDYSDADAQLEVELLRDGQSFTDVRPVQLECCEELDVGAPDGPLRLLYLDAQPRAVAPGEAVAVRAVLDGPAEVTWSAEAGDFADPANERTTWTAPERPGHHRLRIEARSGDFVTSGAVRVEVR